MFERFLVALLCTIGAWFGWSLGGCLLDTTRNKPKPKELTPLDATLIMVNANNKTRRELRLVQAELDKVKRQLAGELPQIEGGIEYGN